MQEIRKKKVESLLREQISRLIQTGKIKDPRIDRFVIITGAEISNDLRDAKIFVSYHGSLKKQDNVVKVLNKAAGFIQGKLAKTIRLRSTPHLRFILDNSLDNARKIEDLLDSINKPENTQYEENKDNSG
jgi:ribosome-binding factor A